MNKTTHEERAKVYADALTTFGANCQLVVALEEMSELQKEICKALRGDLNPRRLAEELADATIMLEQLRQIFGINEPVCDMMDSKILQLKQWIEVARVHQNPDLERIREILQKGLEGCI